LNRLQEEDALGKTKRCLMEKIVLQPQKKIKRLIFNVFLR
jgi:hypothetical protein